ncbi:unnamed protein product [Polarella glacialis]|uniref:Uncharacterized protein n=1 Tax=Polarella glacialis TaxID=89957 RepID=A0A813DTM8_POLGL|nr:unnamed protein product [Polarella glacialis]
MTVKTVATVMIIITVASLTFCTCAPPLQIRLVKKRQLAPSSCIELLARNWCGASARNKIKQRISSASFSSKTIAIRKRHWCNTSSARLIPSNGKGPWPLRL